MTEWQVYIVECSDKTLYTGITNNLTKRLESHNLGIGAKYTKSRNPVSLVYKETLGGRGQALKREIAIKKLSREEKKKLIDRARVLSAKKERTADEDLELKLTRSALGDNKKLANLDILNKYTNFEFRKEQDFK